MAQISTNNEGGMIRYDSSDWMAGFSSYWDSGSSALRITDKKGFVFSTGIDPFRWPGSCSPGPNPTNVTNSSQVGAFCKGGVAYDTSAYITDGSTKLLKLTVASNALVSDANWPHTISAHGGHNTVVSEDAVIYYISGVPYIFYSWNDNTDGDVGRVEPVAPTFDDDYMSTVPTSGAVLSKNFPHPMINGDDGRLYIANGPNLASFDGTTFNASALDLPSGFQITSMAKTQNYLVVFAVRSNATVGNISSFQRQECMAFFWDYVSSSYTYGIPLQGNNVNGAFSYKGTVGCFVSGLSSFLTNDRKSAILIFNGSNAFDQVAQFNTSIPSYGGVETGPNIILFNSDGYLYQYGNPFGDNASLQRSSKSAGSISGLLRYFAETKFFISATTSLEALSGYYDGAEFYTPNLEVPLKDWQTARITKIKIFWSGIGSETTKRNRLDLFYYFNSGANAVKFLDKDALANFASSSEKDTYVTIRTTNADGSPFQTFSSLNISGLYDTQGNTITPPLMRAIEVYYEYVKI